MGRCGLAPAWTAARILLGVVMALLAGPLAFADVFQPNIVPLPAPATSPANAISTLPARRTSVINYEACAREMSLYHSLAEFNGKPAPNGGQPDTGEGVLTVLMAKVQWLLANPATTTPPALPAPPPTGGGGQPPVVVRIVRSPVLTPQAPVLTPIIPPPPPPAPTPPAPTPQPTNCSITRVFNSATAAGEESVSGFWQDIAGPSAGATESAALQAAYGSADCANIVSSKPDPTSQASAPTFDVTYTVTWQCMRDQINTYLTAMQVRGQPGTTGLPCISGNNIGSALLGFIGTSSLTFNFGKALSDFEAALSTQGDWDVTVRDLTRLYYMDRLNGGSLLDSATRTHVNNKLLTIGGAVGPDNYNLLSCGDTDQTTGSAEQRADSSSWLSGVVGGLDNLGSWLWNHLFWLLVIFALLAVAAAAAAALAGLAGAGLLVAGAGVLAAAVAAVALAFFTTVPETENHRLMIESSRYLRDQMDIADLQAIGESPQGLPGQQDGVRQWLFNKYQTVLTSDFSEYNARPYQRYTNIALLNLYDYSTDVLSRIGAQDMLDFNVTKFAVSASEGRRLAPYRRHMTAMKSQLEIQADLFDMNSNGDYQTDVSVLYFGQSSHSADPCPIPNPLNACVLESAVGSTMAASISTYQPDPIAFNVALSPNANLGQQIRNAGIEIYSHGPGYLISAGGIHAGPTSVVKVGGLFPLHEADDEGAALPTSLMIAGVAEPNSLGQLFAIPAVPATATTPATPAVPISYNFLQIEGLKDVVNSASETYDDNVCVTSGFACGVNVEMPADMVGCSISAGAPVAGTAAPWTFVDTSACQPYRSGPNHFYIAIWRQPCPTDASTASQMGCKDNFGFFEIVPAGTMAFSDFAAQTIANNPVATLWPSDLTKPGVYRSTSTHSFTFDRKGGASDHVGIEAIDGTPRPALATWTLAGGTVINGGAGKVVLSDPLSSRIVTLDMTNANQPGRTEATP